MDLDPAVLKDLLNDIMNIIRSAVSVIDDNARPAYQQQLLKVLQDANQPWRERVSAGDALGLLGDPLFDKPCWENPDFWIDIKERDFFRGSVPGEEGAKENEFDGKASRLDAFEIARCTCRNNNRPDHDNLNLGFRVARIVRP